MSMWFFSGKGDEGNTYLFNGSQVQKNNPTLKLIGTMDELTAFIGLAVSFCEHQAVREDLKKIQDILSKLMGVAAGAGPVAIGREGETIMSENLKWMEGRIQHYGEALDNPHAFIYSGETRLGALLDVARTITRRAERTAVSLSIENKQMPAELIGVINRLSSLFYILRLFIDNED